MCFIKPEVLWVIVSRNECSKVYSSCLMSCLKQTENRFLVLFKCSRKRYSASMPLGLWYMPASDGWTVPSFPHSPASQLPYSVTCLAAGGNAAYGSEQRPHSEPLAPENPTWPSLTRLLRIKELTVNITPTTWALYWPSPTQHYIPTAQDPDYPIQLIQVSCRTPEPLSRLTFL